MPRLRWLRRTEAGVSADINDLRRQDDALMGDIDKRLALLEQAHALGQQAAEARDKAAERQIDALTAEVKSAITLWQTVSAEPSASPAGRALLEDMAADRTTLNAHDRMLDAHEARFQQQDGAMRFARAAFGTSIVSAVASVLAIVAVVAGQV